MNRPLRDPPRELLDALHAALPAARVATGSADRLIYSRDMWPRTLLAVQDDRPIVAPPDCIVWPICAAEVSTVLRIAADHSTPVVAWGGGSGVCGGAMAVQGGIALDMKRMCSLVDISDENQLATFQSGILGQTLEDTLNLRGLTLGHFPSSITCSTLGGWLATRSAGQLSSRYGKIEDMVEAMEVVLGDGEIIRCTRRDLPNLLDIFVGSEGTLGVITEATMRVRRLAEQRMFRAYRFPRVAAGCEGMRRVMQMGLRPSVLRLYDEADTLMALPQAESQKPTRWRLASALSKLPQTLLEERSDLRARLLRNVLFRADKLSRIAERVAPALGRGCLLVLGVEGSPPRALVEMALCHSELSAAGGQDLGEAAGLAWYNSRYDVAYKQSPLFASGAFVDTMELATTWDRLLPLYQRVREALTGRAMVLAHFSHAYPEGCSIYFTFAAAASKYAEAKDLYDQIWQRGLSAALQAGSTISHHHGVGLSKAGLMQDEHGEAMEIYRQLRDEFDPHRLLNPGKMGL